MDKDESGYAVGRPEIEKVRYTHMAMIDLMIADPGISQGSIAQHFGYTQSWVCTVMNSDAFQSMLASRRAELVDPAIMVSIEEKFKALASVSVEKLIEYVNRPVVAIDPEILVKAAALGAKTMNLGGHKTSQTVIISSDDRLKLLSEKLTGLLANKKSIPDDTIDVESKDITNGNN